MIQIWKCRRITSVSKVAEARVEDRYQYPHIFVVVLVRFFTVDQVTLLLNNTEQKIYGFCRSRKFAEIDEFIISSGYLERHSGQNHQMISIYDV